MMDRERAGLIARSCEGRALSAAGQNPRAGAAAENSNSNANSNNPPPA